MLCELCDDQFVTYVVKVEHISTGELYELEICAECANPMLNGREP